MVLDGGKKYWMDDGSVIEDGVVLYNNVAGFVPDEYGRMQYSSPLMADGRWAINEATALPEEIAFWRDMVNEQKRKRRFIVFGIS